MWWAGSERRTVYLGSQVAGSASAAGAPKTGARWVRAESSEAALEQALDLGSGDRARKHRTVLNVRLSGALARPFVFDAVEGVKSWKDAVAVAVTVAPEHTGLHGPCSVWLDDWRPGKACVAVAIDTALRDHIEDAVRRRNMKIAALQPWWKLAIDSAFAMPDDCPRILGILDSDSLTVITSDRTRYLGLATYAPKPELHQARAVLTRTAMAADLHSRDVAWTSFGGFGEDSDAGFELVPGLNPCASRGALDVRSLAVDLRSHRTPPRWAWGALGLVVVVAAGLWGTAALRDSKLHALRLQRDKLLPELATAAAPRPLTQTTPTMPYDSGARIALAQAKAGWGPLLAALESMEVVGVTPVAIEVSAPERQVRVEVEFDNLAALIRYLDEINAGEETRRWQFIQAQGSVRTATAMQASAGPTATIQAGW